MAIQVLNIASQFSLSLQVRVISIPWMKRTTTILSLKGMAYNTDSGPVRYVPKKSSPKGIEPENSSPVKGFKKRVLDKKSGVIERTLSSGKKAQRQEQMHAGSSFLDDARVLDEKSGGIGRTLSSGKKTQHQELMHAESSFLDDARVLDEKSGGIGRTLSSGQKTQHQELMHAESSFLDDARVLDKKSGGIGRTLSSGEKTRHQELMHAESSFLNDAQQVKQCDQIVVAFSSEEETNHYLGALDPALMEEPMDDAEEMVIQEESDTFKHNVLMSGAMQDARQLAVKLLATRAFTAVELRKKLLGKSFPPDVVEDVITNFQRRGLIDDSLYAETFSRSRFSSSSWGPRRIMQALSSKGVRKADADKALKLVFKGGECGDHESSLSLSKHSMDQLLAQVSKQWLKSQDAPQETRKSRIVRWLQYRGFSWDVISFVLKKLESQRK